jgi:uncharacterized protein
MRIIPKSEYRETPWKNGGGTTTEIYAAGGERFDWRVSIATVAASGPFSNFAGYDRHIMVLEGDGMSVEVDGKLRVLAPMTPISFSGDSATVGHLTSGPVRDFNLMVNRDFGAGKLSLVNQVYFTSGALHLLIHRLKGDSVLLKPGEEFNFEAAEVVALCEVTPHQPRG